MRRTVAVLSVLVGLLVPFGTAGPATAAGADPSAAVGAAAAGPRFADAGGLTVLAVRHDPGYDGRLWRLTVSSRNLTQPVHVNVVLPAGYAGSRTRYPVLYLFHGTSGSAEDWIGPGHAVESSAGYPMILVIPDGGYDGNGGGWFTDWADQHTALGTANWETFGVDELVPFVDHSLRTRADRSGRAVAGLSQGGYGAFAFAARHPDTYASAGSFSGAPDIAAGLLSKVGATLIIGAVAIGYDNVQPDAFFGNTVLDAVTWRGHNPADLVTNLRETDLNLWTGNGIPGHRDRPFVKGLFGTPVEVLTETSTYSFASIADRAEVPYRLDAYGRGTHSFPYWAADLVDYLPRAADVFAHPRPTPASISYRSIEKRWTQWGWSAVNLRRADHAFSDLAGASAAGFTYTGGPARVTTPPAYTPGATYAVTVGGATSQQTADRAGRLTVDIRSARSTAVVVRR